MGSSFTKNIASSNNEQIEYAIKEKLGINKNDKQREKIKEYQTGEKKGKYTIEQRDEQIKNLWENNALITEKDKNKLIDKLKYERGSAQVESQKKEGLHMRCEGNIDCYNKGEEKRAANNIVEKFDNAIAKVKDLWEKEDKKINDEKDFFMKYKARKAAEATATAAPQEGGRRNNKRRRKHTKRRRKQRRRRTRKRRKQRRTKRRRKTKRRRRKQRRTKIRRKTKRRTRRNRRRRENPTYYSVLYSEDPNITREIQRQEAERQQEQENKKRIAQNDKQT